MVEKYKMFKVMFLLSFYVMARALGDILKSE